VELLDNNKIKVCDLAKQMKTTSSRIMEKLSEIDIYPKSHMSYLEGEELQRFYEHVGYQPDSAKSTNKEVEEGKDGKRLITQVSPSSSTKGVILRRIIVDSDSETVRDNSTTSHDNEKRSKRKGGKRTRNVAASDLRQGFEVRGKDDLEYLLQDTDAKKDEPAQNEEKQAEHTIASQTAAAPSAPKVKRISKNKRKQQEGSTAIEKTQEKGATIKTPEVEKIDVVVAKPAAEKEEKKAEKKEEKKKEVKVETAKKEVKKEEKEPVVDKTEVIIVQEKVEEKTPEPVPEVKKVAKKEEKPEKPVEKKQKAERKAEPKVEPKVEAKKEIVVDAPPVVKPESKKTKSGKVVDTQARKEIKKAQPKPHREKFRGADNFDEAETFRGSRKKKAKNRRSAGQEQKQQQVVAQLTEVKLPEFMTVKDFAAAIKKTGAEVIKKLMLMGVMANLNQEIDFDTAAIVAAEFGINAIKEITVTAEDILFDDTEDDEGMEARPPVVVVMGHVDHGKTSLLDAIRKTSVTDKEAGGITQHIGAYMVKIKGRHITFLDTPGHEAFTSMRARGAQVTDVAILVVAADDGVMPQTIEAINHAKAANVQMVVAVNKIDKVGAEPERIKQQLTEHGVVSDEWGGDVPFVNVSAKLGQNIDELLETVLLTADLMELKANPNSQPKGTVIEAKLDKNRGPVATLLVQRGTLKPGDSIIAGTTFGRIRTMTDEKGQPLKKAGPSTPVEITGLPEVPEAGEFFYAVKDEQLAKHYTEKRKSELREKQLRQSSRVSLDALYEQIQAGEIKDLNVIVKADVQGSVEAIKQSLEKLSNEEVRINIIHGAVGAVNDSDVNLAEVSNAVIIGFNVRPAPNVADHAESVGVDIRLYRVIYDAIEDIETAMKGMLDPEYKEVVQGMVEVRQIFKVSGIGTIAGGYVIQGKITRNSGVRIVREGIVIHEGSLASLKRFKDDVREVVQGYECGLSIEKYNDIKVGDIVESFVMEEIKRN